MSPFYEGLGIVRYEEKDEPRAWIDPNERPVWLPIRDEHTFDKQGISDRHDYGDLRTQFSSVPLPSWLEASFRSKPPLVVHNKLNSEFGGAPVNYLTPATVEQVFDHLTRHFTVIYIRHRPSDYIADIGHDHNESLPGLFDEDVLLQNRGVVDFSRAYNEQRLTGVQNANAFKAAIYSRCHHFLSVQGGGSHQIALFSGSMLVILHRRGREMDWAYSKGYYRFVSRPPPTILACCTQAEIIRTIKAFPRSSLIEGRVQLGSCDDQLRGALSPETLKRRLWLVAPALMMEDTLRRTRTSLRRRLVTPFRGEIVRPAAAALKAPSVVVTLRS